MSSSPIAPYEASDQKPSPPSYDASMDAKPLYPALQPQPVVPPVAPVVVSQVQYVAAPSFGPSPMVMTCSRCQKSITTRTNTEPSTMAWIIGGVLCFVGCVPCCLIPCFIDSMQPVIQACPACNSTLGRFNPQ